MPWKESRIVNERMQFVSRLQSGEKMTDLCREFGVSRKTGYKIKDRFKRFGPTGLYDESRRPVHSPNQTSPQVRALIIATKKQKPHWGASKVRGFLLIKNPKIEMPSRYTVHSILTKEGLIERKKRRPTRILNQPFVRNPATSKAANDLWCADFKGQFRVGNGKYCYPLTITDHYSRYLLSCESLEDVGGLGAISVFQDVFREFGLPRAIRTDNGAPFASRGLFGLSKLSVWWLRLGIAIERIEPGHPEQNGRHERMHLTLKQQTTRPAGRTLLEQQQRFDEFREEFNNERPHEALKLKRPKDFFRPSSRSLPKDLLEPSYPLHDIAVEVNQNGVVVARRSGIEFHLSQAFAGQIVGLREEEEARWKVSFMNMDLGFYDQREGDFHPTSRPTSSGR